MLQTSQIDLASTREIADLLDKLEQRLQAEEKMRRAARKTLPQRAEKVLGKPQRFCQCGKCRRCLENARWERIFNNKFADLEYYSRLRLRQSSTLAAAPL